jgi:phage terminase large subunit-like protein
VVELLALGGNRAGKTEWAAKAIVKAMVEKPNSRFWCLHADESSSREVQQSRIYKYLPSEWRPREKKLSRGKSNTTKVDYTLAGGFVDNMFVLPNGSMCKFKFYSQDVKRVEGTELDGAWSDEEIPMDWIEAVNRRIASRTQDYGWHLITFTPLSGYTTEVSYFLDGAVTTMAAEAECLPLENGAFEKVPLIQQCKKRSRGVVYFHTRENPYGTAYTALKAAAEEWPRTKIKTVLYGIPTKVKGALFPLFDPTIGVHVCRHEDLPKTGTYYLICDPCSGRNFFMIWCQAVGDQLFICREWPQEGDYIPAIGDPGPWAVPSGSGKADGDKGEAQQPFGFGFADYIAEIERVNRELGAARGLPLEGGKQTPVELERSIMDSRFGKAPTLRVGGTVTLVEAFEEECEYHWDLACGDEQNQGFAMISNALAYDTSKPVSPLNRPKLIISERCQNLIFALQNYTGKDGQKGAMKDPVDCLRYALQDDLEDVATARSLPDAPRRGACY